MKVIFHTNIDAYRGVKWPEFTDHVPRKGEIIELEYQPKTGSGHKCPPRLEVAAVRYCQDPNVNNGKTYARVELWFNETDFKLYGGGEKLLN